MNVLEQCRIRTGRVVAVEGERATVRTSPLAWDGDRLSLGDERDEQVRWSDGGQGLLDAVSVGDLVALHWDWVCDVLDEPSQQEIIRREAAQLAALPHV